MRSSALVAIWSLIHLSISQVEESRGQVPKQKVEQDIHVHCWNLDYFLWAVWIGQICTVETTLPTLSYLWVSPITASRIPSLKQIWIKFISRSLPNQYMLLLPILIIAHSIWIVDTRLIAPLTTSWTTPTKEETISNVLLGRAHGECKYSEPWKVTGAIVGWESVASVANRRFRTDEFTWMSSRQDGCNAVRQDILLFSSLPRVQLLTKEPLNQSFAMSRSDHLTHLLSAMQRSQRVFGLTSGRVANHLYRLSGQDYWSDEGQIPSKAYMDRLLLARKIRKPQFLDFYARSGIN